MQSVEDKVVKRIYAGKRGMVFTPPRFFDLGSENSVRKALQTLSEKGVIRRLGRGLYDYPASHPKLGVLTPTPEQIAMALAGKDKTRIQPSGAYAANLLGLTLQVPAEVTFLTDGATRTVTVGNQTITLKRTTPKNMAAAGRISGLVIQALRYLGQKHVNQKVIDTLDRRLSPEDRKTLLRDIKLAPAWIGEIIRQLAKKDA
ncbi:hypothetical protein K239x_50960 [Planctomycetes bacterium K23_9]|uniref:AbiEi antitoxin C-terminal domain-containing protein n=2 Tax=Stieleria marina TaxID=1930275 RepID=A0A517P130_9BACT|nr:hypothetical protein K239x_50960 [Planctomycetes bacterium K23_9]